MFRLKEKVRDNSFSMGGLRGMVIQLNETELKGHRTSLGWKMIISVWVVF